jgi:hypothetical protein
MKKYNQLIIKVTILWHPARILLFAPGSQSKAPKGVKKQIMKRQINTSNTSIRPQMDLPAAPLNPTRHTPAGQAGHPSSSDSYRLTQYLAFHSTMYCKVPSNDIIFVMQAGQKAKKDQKSQTGKNEKNKSSLKTIKLKYMSLSIKTFALVAMLLTASSTFATPTDDSNEMVKVAFHKDFKKAQLTATEVKATYTKLTFKMNGVVMYAFYSDNGQLLAVTRNITSDQLPIQLLMDLKKNYADYWITDLFELTGDGASNYYITLENADQSVTLRSNGSDSWDTYQKKSKQ